MKNALFIILFLIPSLLFGDDELGGFFTPNKFPITIKSFGPKQVIPLSYNQHTRMSGYVTIYELKYLYYSSDNDDIITYTKMDYTSTTHYGKEESQQEIMYDIMVEDILKKHNILYFTKDPKREKRLSDKEIREILEEDRKRREKNDKEVISKTSLG